MRCEVTHGLPGCFSGTPVLGHSNLRLPGRRHRRRHCATDCATDCTTDCGTGYGCRGRRVTATGSSPYDAKTGESCRQRDQMAMVTQEGCAPCSGTTWTWRSRERWRGVSEPAGATGPAGASWRSVNLVLIVVVLALSAASIVLFTKGASATPDSTEAQALSAQYKQVTGAAREETLAFLTVDYSDMDPLIAKVVAGSTGTFKKRYERAEVNLKTSAQRARARSTGRVLSVGIADIDDGDAVVLVAADSQVSNRSTRSKPQPRYYRLRLTMVRKGDTWLTSDLQFVG